MIWNYNWAVNLLKLVMNAGICYSAKL